MFSKLPITRGGEVLDYVMVIGYNDTYNLSSDADYGMRILKTGYCVCFALIMIILPMFVIMTGKSFEGIIANRQRSGDWTKPMCTLVSFTLTIFVINTLALTAEFEQLGLLDSHERTIYSLLKTVFLCVLVSECVLVSTVYCFFVNCHRERDQVFASIIFMWFSLCSISFFFCTIFLGIIPLILLIFAFPIYTSALVTLHYTMIYSSTIILAIVIYYDVKMVGYCNGNKKQQNSLYHKEIPYSKWCSYALLVFYIVPVGIAVFLSVGIVYIYTMLMFQFLVSRYNLSGDSAKAFSTFFPSIVITLTTYFLDKLIFNSSVVSEQIVYCTTFIKDNGQFGCPKEKLIVKKTIHTDHLCEYNAFIPLDQ